MQIDAVLTSPPTWARSAAAQIEQLGYDGLVIPEAAHDAFMIGALAASATERVTIATSIAIAFARTPMVTAIAANDVQQLSGGRFTVGLGPQIKPHIENRYGMPWSKPAARMREYVEALRAIWRTWHEGAPLDFRGEFYTHTLMTPMFTPAVTSPPPAVHVAGVGPRMVEVAGAVADGLIVHPMATHEQIAAVTRPALDEAARAADRTDRASITAWVMVGCGADTASLDASRELVRAQIGFYGSTPVYTTLLAHHGDDGLQPELRRLSKAGDWDEMTGLVDDEILHRYAVVGDPDAVATELVGRYSGLVDRLCLVFMSADPDAVAGPVLDGIRAELGPADTVTP